MRINIKFLQTGGVPLTNDLMDVLQDAYSIFNVLGDVAGHLTILSGCTITGQSVSPGIVAINGDVLYFEGGLVSSSVYIHTAQITKTFQDQTDKILVEKKTVKFGLSTPDNMWNWVDFKRLDTIKVIMEKLEATATQLDLTDIKNRLEVVEMKTAPIRNDGVVMIWLRNTPIPPFWKECTDLRGRTPIGYDPNYVYNSTIHALNYQLNQMGANIGDLSHKLIIAELAKHGHSAFVNNDWGGAYPAISHSTGGNLGYGIVGGGDNGWSFSVRPEGGDKPHNNVQPSKVVMFIEPNFP